MQFDRTKCLAALKRCRCLNQLESCLEEGLRQLKIKCIVLFGRLRGCGNSPRDLYVMLNERRIEDTRRKMPWQLGNIEYLLAMEEIYARKKNGEEYGQQDKLRCMKEKLQLNSSSVL